MQIVITGAGGYLGGRLAKRFRQAGHAVLPIRRGEVSLPPADAVIHAACCYGRRGESASELFSANVAWPAHILKKLHPNTLFLNTDTILPPELSRYAASKAIFRREGAALAAKRNVRWRNLRLEHFYGPGEGDDKFISSLVRACLKEAEANLTGGEQRREFIFIDDVVRAFEVAFANPDDQDFYGGTGKPIRIRDLAERIHILCGSQATLRFGARPCRENEPIDIGKPDAIPLVRLGWRPAVELDDGLRQVIEFEKARTCVCS